MATTVTITYTKPAAGAVVIDPTGRQESSVFINPTGMPLNNNNSLYGVDLRNEEHYKDLNTDAGIIKIPAFKIQDSRFKIQRLCTIIMRIYVNKKLGHSVPQCIKVFHSVSIPKTSHGNV